MMDAELEDGTCWLCRWRKGQLVKGCRQTPEARKSPLKKNKWDSIKMYALENENVRSNLFQKSDNYKKNQ